MSKFWVVQLNDSLSCDGTERACLQRRFDSKEDAESSAATLAAKSGKEFVILEAMTCVRKPLPDVEVVEL